jgi:hypothetical protein
MTYELCKQLKDAGFPQEVVRGEMLGRMRIPDMNAYSPTLEELIEACGNDFTGLSNGKEWRAVKLNAFTGPEDIEGLGSTPSEAVANLWLKLQEK